MAIPSLDEETAKKVLRQVEFYFSDSNLPRDNFLMKSINESSDATVSLALICSFTRMRSHLNLGNVKPDEVPEETLQAVAETLRKSTSVKVSEDGKRVGRTTELPKPEEIIEQLDIRTIAASPFEHNVKLDDVETFFSQIAKVSSVRLPHHFQHKKSFSGTALIEFSTEEEAEKVLKQILVYAGAELELKPKKDYDAEADRVKETQNVENSASPSDSEANYPKGLILAFTLKCMSAGGSAKHDEKDAKVTDDFFENASDKTEQTASVNVDRDGEISGKDIEEKKDEAVEKNGLDGEVNETEDGEKTSKGSIEENVENEEKLNAASYKDNMDVVMREDMKVIFQNFGTVKYIDFKMGADTGFVRFEEPEASQKARAVAALSDKAGLIVKNYIAILEPVTGEAEKEYWSLLRGGQDKHRDNNKSNRGRGGKFNRGGKHARSRDGDSFRGHHNKAHKIGST